MNINKISVLVVLNNLKNLGLINEDGVPISYGKWKNKASIGKYGKPDNQLKIVFIGFPNENVFGFYVDSIPDNEAMKEAYGWFLKLAKGKIDPEMHIQWGNRELPKKYENLKAFLPTKK